MDGRFSPSCRWCPMASELMHEHVEIRLNVGDQMRPGNTVMGVIQ